MAKFKNLSMGVKNQKLLEEILAKTAGETSQGGWSNTTRRIFVHVTQLIRELNVKLATSVVLPRVGIAQCWKLNFARGLRLPPQRPRPSSA